jgi:predicted ATPase
MPTSAIRSITPRAYPADIPAKLGTVQASAARAQHRVDAVGDRHLLVVLDNAEHVLGAAAKLADAMPGWPLSSRCSCSRSAP